MRWTVWMGSRLSLGFLLTVAIGGLLLGPCPAAHADWKQVNESGFGRQPTRSTWTMQQFGDHLYAGTGQPGRLYRTTMHPDPHTGRYRWTSVPLPRRFPGVNDFEPTRVVALAVLRVRGRDRLYMAVNGSDGAEYRSAILMTDDGTRWSRTGLIQSGVVSYTCLGVFGGHLYAPVGDEMHSQDATHHRVYRTDGTRWERLPAGPTLGPGDIYFGDVIGWRGFLYAGTSGKNHATDRTSEVWRTRDGRRWTRVAALHSPTMVEVESMAVFHNQLYVGTKNHPGLGEASTGPEVWRSSDGITWSRTPGATGFDPGTLHVDTLQQYAGRLYAGLGGGDGRAEIYSTADGTTWRRETPRLLAGDATNYLVGAMHVMRGRLLVGTGFNTETGTEIWELGGLETDVTPRAPSRVGVRPLPEELRPEAPSAGGRIETPLTNLPGLTPAQIAKLKGSGVTTVESLAKADPQMLARRVAVNIRATQAWVRRAQAYVRAQSQPPRVPTGDK